MKLIERDDTLFVICDNEDVPLFKGDRKYVYTIDSDVYWRVAQFVELFEDGLVLMMKLNDTGGNRYWDEGWHEHLAKTIHALTPNTDKSEISNALTALGY